MYKKGIVVKIEDEQITVLPLIKDACASCGHKCSELGNSIKEPFLVSNTHSLPLEEGMVVGISTEKKAEAIQGLVSLFLPFLSAIAGFLFSSKIASILGADATEGFKALCTLAFLSTAAMLVLIVTRLFPFAGQNKIVEVYRNEN